MDQRCGRCKQVKDSEEFSPSYRGRNGTWCRACFAAYNRGERGTTEPHPAQVCSYCGTEFRPKALKRNALGYCSRECKERADADSGAQRDRHLRRKFGITQAEYEQMLADQGGTCALCDATPDTQKARYRTYFHVDHCHDTGRVRGLLCGAHNMLLGRFNDDPGLLRRAAEYLEAAAS